MLIVTQLPDISAQSRAFISGRSKVHGMVTYIHKQREGNGGKGGSGREYRWLCGHVFTNQCGVWGGYGEE